MNPEPNNVDALLNDGSPCRTPTTYSLPGPLAPNKPGNPQDNPFRARISSIDFISSSLPPVGSTQRGIGIQILNHLFPGAWYSTALWWDDKLGKKATSGQTKKRFVYPPPPSEKFPHVAKDFYVECENLFVVDFDSPSHLALEALESIGPNCNCIAGSRRGVHFYFRGPIPDLRGKQLDGLDIRTGGGDKKRPDIIFAAPSFYETPTGQARYEWIRIPATSTGLLPPPPALLNLLRSYTSPTNRTLRTLTAPTQAPERLSNIRLRQNHPNAAVLRLTTDHSAELPPTKRPRESSSASYDGPTDLSDTEQRSHHTSDDHGEPSTSSDSSATTTDTDNSSSSSGETEAEHPTSIYSKDRDKAQVCIVSANTCSQLASRGDIIALVSIARIKGWDVVCCQECLCPNLQFIEQDYLVWSGRPIGKSRLCNLTMVDKRRLRNIVPRKQISHPRIQVTDLSFNNYSFSLLNVHRPYTGCKQMSKAEFDPTLTFILSKLDTDRICAGDFNGDLDLEAAKSTGVVQQQFQGRLSSATTDHDMLNLMKENKLRVLNYAIRPIASSWAPPGATLRYSNTRKRQMIPDGSESSLPTSLWKTADYFAASADLSHRVCNFQRERPIYGSSDHFALACTLRISKPAPPMQPKTTSTFAKEIKSKVLPPKAKSKRKLNQKGSHHTAPLDSKAFRLQRDLLAINRHEDPNAFKKAKRRLKRLGRKLESRRWANLAYEMSSAVGGNNLRRAFQILNEAIDKAGPQDKGSKADIQAAIKAAEISLNQPEPLDGFTIQAKDIPDHSLVTESEVYIRCYTDGSKKRIGRRHQAGCAFWVPSLERAERCKLPDSIRQTSTAGEVCAVLLLLVKMRDLPARFGLHIVTDNAGVAYFIEHKLEELLEQDFSNCAHAEIWRAIVHELVKYPRAIRATWTRSHTQKTDEDSIGNCIVDSHAHLAIWDADTGKGKTTCDCPPFRYEPVEVAVRRGPPSRDEVFRAICLLNKSAPGPDGILASTLQDPEVFDIIFQFISHAWQSGTLPEDVLGSQCSFIPKKAAGKMRAINIPNTIIKVIENVIRTRLRVIPLIPCQHGFQRSRDCDGAIRILLNAARLARKKDRGLYIIFLDFKDAYNSIRRDALWDALRAHGIEESVISLIRQSFTGTTKVKDSSASFSSTSGVYQGSCISPSLFNLLLDCAIQASDLKEHFSNCIFYADDGVIFAEDLETACSLLQSFTSAANAFGLELNTEKDKTEAMYILPPSHEARWKQHSSKARKSSHTGDIYGNKFSGTALTQDGTNYVVRSPFTHLWCPICTKGFQARHTSTDHAFSLLDDHFKKTHNDKSLSGFHHYVPISTKPYRPSKPINPFPDTDISVVQRLWKEDRWTTSSFHIRWVTGYKYLGQLVDNCANSHASTEHRLKAANGAFHGLHTFWQMTTVANWIKTWLLEIVIYPTLTYGLGTVCVPEADIKEMEFHHRLWLMATTGLQDETPKGSSKPIRTPYEVLCKIANTPSIEELLRSKRLQLAGRIERASPSHPLKLLKSDEWDALIDSDLSFLDESGCTPIRHISRDILSQKYRCSLMLHRDNPHTYFNNH